MKLNLAPPKKNFWLRQWQRRPDQGGRGGRPPLPPSSFSRTVKKIAQRVVKNRPLDRFLPSNWLNRTQIKILFKCRWNISNTTKNDFMGVFKRKSPPLGAQLQTLVCNRKILVAIGSTAAKTLNFAPKARRNFGLFRYFFIVNDILCASWAGIH